ncbi:carboxypeptidase-like regulatory domain-containing protein [Marinifilum fragile]|uniref:carboxypeptidase-like regulatory domain-containing protein n=1 Tax=Marinifilum fragile TaxID=570161 RepID=UPI002AA733DE|nr:carboxypeptidase-like regulatory domain-containing protein [Marinifilum fragile]
MKKILLFLLMGVLSSFVLHAQTGNVSGKVRNSVDRNYLSQVKVEVLGTNLSTYTDAEGNFLISEVPQGKHLLEFILQDFKSVSMAINVVAGSTLDLKMVELEPSALSQSFKDFDFSSLTDEELDDEGSKENISGLLASSKDVFVSNAGYVFSQLRFKTRGYSSDNTSIRMNGMLMNDMENGRGYWYKWGGLNDATRNQEIQYGLGANGFGFGGFGGTTNINTMAIDQRVGTKLVYSYSNKSYSNRVMATHSTGLMENGWAFTVSGSRRWGDEGYVDATFYDAYSYFLSAYKQLNDNHSLNLTVFAAPSERGKGGASTQEVYDLVGDNYYNPYWGYQNGEKRNSRVSKSHQPVFMLNHDWKINEKTNLKTGVSYAFGRNGSTRLSWFNAPDPRPDYYSKLPSNSSNPEEIARLWKTDPKVRHIDWNKMYQINSNDPNAQYFLEENRYDAEQLMANTIFTKEINNNWKLTAGLEYTHYVGSRFNVMDDLLGAEYFLDYDKYAPTSIRDNDLNNPDNKVKEGDTFGFDYDVHLRKGGFFAQTDFVYNQWEGYIGAEVSQTKMWRDGKMEKAVFAGNSYGESTKKDFTNFGVKGGVTYKLNGRNYFTANAAYQTRAPFLRNSFESARTRNVWVNGLKNEKDMSFDAGYQLRSPFVKASVRGFYTRYQDQTEVRNYFVDGYDNMPFIPGSFGNSAFVNAVMTGIDKEHMGVEIGVEAKLTPTITAIFAGSKGQYIWDSRPTLKWVSENTGGEHGTQTVYAKNFYVAGTPQTAATLGLKYSSPKYWWAGVNANYYDDTYLDFYPGRRTTFALIGQEPGSEAWNRTINQRKLPDAFTLDLNLGKSWKIKDYYISLNANVNNVLDDTDIITGGYEQSRYDITDPGKFGDKLYYYYGRTYFVNLSVRF